MHDEMHLQVTTGEPRAAYRKIRPRNFDEAAYITIEKQ